ncbi:Na+/H+ antiporter subunit E [Aquamicrobium sp. LC103]|uniref:Na+/H+ antiporter subunit E n=1 Tax=Aquamicrobium sp. LC103 TaxID=1120658 RepID=UPI00063EA320|nr:Na+/H+ antiporter subunit E [Aquamicrobium sp. LC103]TKT75064.1 Na+/H+ antiporter subunit E [Aquamicrobium sp. LC103]
MSRVLPYPLLSASLLVMWLLLNRFSLGHLVLGAVIALFAAQGLAALHPAKPRLRRWDLIPKLIGIVLYDIIRSNVAVSRIILQGKRRERRSGFITIPLDLRDNTGLAILAVIITSTPGTAWLDYNTSNGSLLIHVFDLVDESEWVELIKNRYEYLLMEIFE